MVRAGIYGGSGYTGQELLRLLIPHPLCDVSAVTSRQYKGMAVSDVYPHLRGLTDLAFVDASPEAVSSLSDVVFLAVPHGEAMEVAPEFLKAGKQVVDLSADYRLQNLAVYEQWYRSHSSPEYLTESVYGIPELYRERIVKARLVANPGCYPTSIVLGLAPLLRERLVDAASLIIDAKSGASGAGREAVTAMLFCEVNEGFRPYKVGAHRHTPEIEQELSLLAGTDVRVLFTPHLIPANRGILSTMYATLLKDVDAAVLVDQYREYYRGEPFIRIYDAGTFPGTASVRGSNFCDIGIAVDHRTGRVLVISTIDNLVKGAAGQAIQNMNLMVGLPEDSGLNLTPLFP